MSSEKLPDVLSSNGMKLGHVTMLNRRTGEMLLMLHHLPVDGELKILGLPFGVPVCRRCNTEELEGSHLDRDGGIVCDDCWDPRMA